MAIKEGSQQILDKVNAKQWMEAERAYERMIKDFERRRWQLYYGLIRPYVERLVSMGRKEQAMDAIDYLKKRDVLDLGPEVSLVWKCKNY